MSDLERRAWRRDGLELFEEDVQPVLIRNAGASSGFAPALLAQLGDVTRKADERLLDPMPVRVVLLLDDSPIFVLGGFPTGGAHRANMKGSDVIRAHKRCREQRRCHRCLPVVR